MTVVHREEVRLTVPESWMIGSRTRLMHSYHGELEEIRLPELFFGPEEIVVSRVKGESQQLTKMRRIRNPLRRVNARKRLDGGRAVWVEGRNVTAGNISLFLMHAVFPYLYAKKLQQEGALHGDLQLIVENRLPQFAYEILEELGIPFWATDSVVRGEICSIQYGDMLTLRSRARSFLPRWTPEASCGSKVFISRTSGRRIKNESEIKEYLTALGFETVYFEGMSVKEQWAAVAQASQVVAIHGAGVINLLAAEMARQGSKVSLVELFGPGYVVEPYRILAAAMGWTYRAARGLITPSVVRDLDVRGIPRSHSLTDFEISVDAVEKAITSLP